MTHTASVANAVRLFGPLSVELDGRSLGPRDFGGVKPKQVLEVLLVERGRAVPKDEIADLVWGESLPVNVSATLDTYVSVVRSRLGDERRLVATEPGGFRFDPAEASIDLDEFDELLREAAGAPIEARRERLTSALAIATGDVLADEPYGAWALDVRGLYAERRVQATCDLAEACLALGDLTAALDHCAQALALDPVLERAHRVAMLAHYARGDEARALRAYERCRTELVEALGTTPTPETAVLHAAILRRDDPRVLIPAHVAGPEEDLLPVPSTSTGTRYAYNGEVSLAFQTVGEGPDLVFVPGFMSHVEAAWEDPTYASFMRWLARDHRLVIFDKRGTGLSDPVTDWPTLDERVDDMLAVIDAAGCERPVLFGVCEGGPMCMLAAARHPERVSALVLHGSWSRLVRGPDYPWGWSERSFDAFLAGFDEAWTNGTGHEITNPSASENPRYLRWYARYLRLSASPGMARRMMRLNAVTDIEDVLPEIDVPTLIMHRTAERWVTVENSYHLRDSIPGARLVELPGVDHHPWIGEVEPVHRALSEFLNAVPAE